jgi:glycerol-3-phosphate acyltransferase PlsY
MMVEIFGLVVVAYLIGSVPFGFVVARARGIDLRKMGSGNIGATNVYRAMGLRIALFVFTLDVCKGFIATRVLPTLIVTDTETGYLRLVCALGVLAGSIAGVFMRFRGGKGVATGVGVFLGLAPVVTLICLGIWAGLVAKFRYVSLGSICGAVALPVLLLVLGGISYATNPVFYLALIVAALVVVRHVANIRRLLTGTEHRIGRTREERV